MTKFTKELTDLINKHSLENGSDTPDFILAQFIVHSIRVFDEATHARDDFFNRAKPDPRTGITVNPGQVDNIL